MKKILFSLLVVFSANAYAMTYFLTGSWWENGNQMCRYGNGTVLNMGTSLCPLSIQGR
jgi:hypothetical protein